MGGGGGLKFFSHFMLFLTFLEKKIWEYKTIISHLMFSLWFFRSTGPIAVARRPSVRLSTSVTQQPMFGFFSKSV